jgi:thymidylate synthase
MDEIINQEEQQYLDLLKNILEKGEKRDDRTGVGTLSLFGCRMEFDLTKGFPLFTTRKMPWKIIIKELLWMLSGSTDVTKLQSQDVHIWDGNSTRDFLDKRGLSNLPEWDIGAGYGHQWRHFDAPYNTCKDDYTGKGVDQISKIIKLIKEEPTSRRIVLCAWNPAQEDQMALPPCHILAQFYVREGIYLDCQLYQRSQDVALAANYNITAYSALTVMFAHVTGLQAGKFIHVIGDAHVYLNHVDAVKELLTRQPYSFPQLKITNQTTDIFQIKLEDFQITGYKSHPTLKMPMAI